MKTFLGFDIEEWRNVRFIILQNFVVSTFILMFLWDGWETMVFKYVSLGSILELLLVFVSVLLYLDFARRVYKAMENKRVQMAYIIVCLVMAMLVIGGTGIHFAANQIRATVDAPIIEFYDEYLSHYMILIGIIGLNGFFAFFQRLIPLGKSLGNPEIIVIGASGVIQGVICALGILESRFGLYGIVTVSVFFSVLAMIQSEKSIRRYPLYIFYDVSLLTIIICISLWLIKFGSFVEPSAINFGRF